MAFNDVRLNEEIERGSQGGPSYKTTVFEINSGFEQRNVDWSRSRGRWDISYGLRDKADAEDVLAIFHTSYGRAHTFRFKDWTDYQIGNDSTDTPQEIAVADGVATQFQIVRRYTAGSTNLDRPVTRVVSGTTRVFLNSVEQMSGWTVDVDTGVVTFTGAPSDMDTVEVICEFDVPVRFDVDHLDMLPSWDGDYALPAITIVEVREALQTLS